MSENAVIDQFVLSEREDLLEYLRLAYRDDPRKSDPAFWNWHFLENPNTSPDNIPLWVVKNDGRIVGQLATIPVNISVDGVQRPALWVLDFIVDRDHRGKGLGKRLVIAAKEHCPTLMTLGINEQSTAVFRSLRWAAVGGLRRYHKFFFPGNAVAEIARHPIAREVVNAVYAPIRTRPSEMSASISIRNVTDLDPSFGDLAARVSGQWPCAVIRDPAYLKWQFLEQPGKRSELLAAYVDGKLVGYIVLFLRKPYYGTAPYKAAISDLVYDADSSLDIIGELLNAAISRIVERKAGSLVTDVLDERIERRLKDLGFWRVKSSPQFMVSADDDQDRIYDEANWFLTRADSDVSIFEEPNL